MWWSIALEHGAERLLINKEIYCPWCGEKHIHITDDDYK